MDEWKPKFDDLLKSNESVQKAIVTVKGESLQRVVNAIIQMDEFNVLSQKVRDYGLPVNCSIANLQKLLEWSYDICACEANETNECL